MLLPRKDTVSNFRSPYTIVKNFCEYYMVVAIATTVTSNDSNEEFVFAKFSTPLFKFWWWDKFTKNEQKKKTWPRISCATLHIKSLLTLPFLSARGVVEQAVQRNQCLPHQPNLRSLVHEELTELARSLWE